MNARPSLGAVTLMWTSAFTLITASLPVLAVEANKRTRLAPAMQVKVNKAVSRSYRLGGEQEAHARERGRRFTAGCGNMSFGNVQALRSHRAENVTVVRGDVINVNRFSSCR